MKSNELKKIYKISSTELKAANWNLDLPFEKAVKERPDLIVSLGESQVLRWIDELNGVTNYNEQVRAIKNAIKRERKKEKTASSTRKIKQLYTALYNLQFCKDYVCVVMARDNHYDRANKGFTINGIKYRRFLGTNGGIKKSTIVYVNEKLYPILKERLDNGRNVNIPLVPAKLEAYQALVCSGSVPLPMPKGFIVVDDCITHFKDNVITISDDTGGEPELKYVEDYEIEHNDSDGYGLMLPSYSERVNQHLNGKDGTISGMNTRYAWTKGMIYTFDFVEFAEKVAGTYEIVDAWGMKRDVRNAEVILTTSMLKLWNCYNSWEEFKLFCDKNNYEFSTPKTTPETLENQRTTNYQYLQSYDFTDEELQGFVKPTIDEIRDILGMDYRKAILFMDGQNLSADNIDLVANDVIKAMMIDPQMINDPYVRRKILDNIQKTIDNAAKGTVSVNGNYAMISGDPYALAQSMFGLEITGILKAGEIYHKYWIDKGASEVVCFRAPMTCHNNIRRMKLNNSEQAQHWYQYITTAQIFNAWDTACDAMNGADKDGDTNMTTDNPYLLAKTKNSPTIVCMQRKADKKIVTEFDIIEANKLAFNDDIGTITNYVTSMFDVQAGFAPDTEEYKTLAYRIMCGQHYQQASIDRAKGIIAEPMPEYWYRLKKGKEYSDLEQNIVANRKPYFMTYVYPNLARDHKTYMKNNERGAVMRFGSYGIGSIAELEAYEPKTQEMIDYLQYYYKLIPTGINACVVNRIAWIIEDAFKGYKPSKVTDFDYTILKTGIDYPKATFRAINQIYQDYLQRVDSFMVKAKWERIDKEDVTLQKAVMLDDFRAKCAVVCPDEKMLCDIVLDICYNSNLRKSFAWDMCGEQIIKNLLAKNNNTMRFPVAADDGDITFRGNRFKMVELKIDEGAEDGTDTIE